MFKVEIEICNHLAERIAPILKELLEKKDHVKVLKRKKACQSDFKIQLFACGWNNTIAIAVVLYRVEGFERNGEHRIARDLHFSGLEAAPPEHVHDACRDLSRGLIESMKYWKKRLKKKKINRPAGDGLTTN